MVILKHDLVVDVSTNNYTLMLDKRKLDKKGNPVYETLGYYSTLQGAVCGARDYYIKKKLEADTHTLNEAIDIVRKINKEFFDLLKEVMQNEEMQV